jgi:diaminopimelate epimerase
MRFEKWQALGNDYVIVERDQLPFELTAARVRKLCAGHFGVFADGVLLIERSEDPELVARLRIYNPDGSQAELSGNGAREAILYLRRRGFTDRDEFAIDTAAGTIRPTITGPDTCRVDMGRASLASKDYPGGAGDGRGELVANGRAWSFQHVSIGNPQCAIHIPDLVTLRALDLPVIGPGIEAHELFPNRTNVSWYTEIEPPPEPTRGGNGAAGDPAGPGSLPVGRIGARIFERGVGETLSSGTGACGAAVAYHLNGGPPTVQVQLDGGQLEVEIGEDMRVRLTGWARPVFAGELSEDFCRELHDTSE